ncbi:MAG: hypothetical protein J6S69_04010 [Proteobacteria bacterium]|nr:hypothetical protein [Pseudomonadota bacterium]
MAICLNCNRKSETVGQLCSCGTCYMVHDEHGMEPLNLLGKLIANKIIPTAVVSVDKSTISYEAFQPAIDRVVGLSILKPEYSANPDIRVAFLDLVDRCAGLKQQNTPTLLEVLELPSEGVLAITSEVFKGEKLSDYMRNNPLDPVGLMHIVHQILQAVAAMHRKNVLFPHLGMDNIRIMRLGGDSAFVTVRGFVESNITWLGDLNTQATDVFYIGQLVLSLICGKPVVNANHIELPPERAYLMPIAQIFLRAVAPVEQRYASCIDMLEAFETAFDLNAREAKKPVLSNQSQGNTAQRRQSPVTFEQIIWMHRPPQRQD